ncbi:Verruc_Plancto-restricted protein [Neorhodopirellula lusitana]|uniref:Verruc_Plancto-restricted protein n=1 Tax=Neorhodopirellula lusitana TaxID=445327 RepID=A0ABY1QE61_9BACT|nr:Minf_1886 family protein [Neorhodopirellula lusitana]SMP68403.1 Verruc_Plancto-restricted protein [Neorhodopirellula lusitana]
MTSPLKAMRDLLRDDPRYKLDAYQFIRESLQYAHENLDRIGPLSYGVNDHPDVDNPRHLTGQQLCEACRLYAIDQYGYLAKMVLANWGLKSTSDFGELVYNLIRIEQMRKSESDNRADFDDVYSFEEAFQPQFELVTDESE